MGFIRVGEVADHSRPLATSQLRLFRHVRLALPHCCDEARKVKQMVVLVILIANDFSEHQWSSIPSACVHTLVYFKEETLL